MTTHDQTGQSDAGPQRPQLSRWVRIMAIGRNPKVTLMRIAVLIVALLVMGGYRLVG